MGKVNVVIAEDESDILFGLSIILRAKNYRVVETRDGKSALRAILEMHANGTPCDLLICDIQMPKMNGEELICELHRRELYIPTLAISGYGNKSLVVRLMRLGCHDFIDKPFLPDFFEKRVERVLNSTRIKRKKRLKEMDYNRLEDRTQQFVHDLNNLLGIAIGNTDLILEEIGGSEYIRNMLDRVLRSTEEASRICRRLQDLNKNGLTSQLQTTNVNLCVHSIANLLASILPENIRIVTKIVPYQLWIEGDAERIQQALLNLGLNAIEALAEGGEIEIQLAEASRCFFEKRNAMPEKTRSDFLRISVSNTGDGMPKEIQHRIFEKGYTTKANGTGIGLYAVKEIVEEHRGKISFISLNGMGTRFEIVLPISKNQISIRSSLPAPEPICF